jgi:hypothetical protein
MRNIRRSGNHLSCYGKDNTRNEATVLTGELCT